MKSLVDRFWSKVDRCEPDQCWEWKAAKDIAGYGRLNRFGRPELSHRVSYQLHHGPIPEGLHVLHSCDNPGCVNPAHLHLGTNTDNIREKMERGRCSRSGGLPPGSCGGETNHKSKLTNEQAIQIRIRYAAGGVSQKQLGDEFGVSRGVISSIINGRSYRI